MVKGNPIIISDDEPLVVGKLYVYPDRLDYRGKRCNFRDIQHIRWYWLSRSTSFLNTQNVELSIYVRGMARPISISKSTLYVTPKLVTAYEYIARQTFQSRLTHYTDQLEEFGAFTFQKSTFYSDGRILGNGKVFNLADAQSEPFRMIARIGGLLGPRLVIDLTLDRDVIVSILTYILQNPKDPHEIIGAATKRRQQRERADSFLIQVFSMLAKMAAADGIVSGEEIRVVRKFAVETLNLTHEQLKVAVEIFQTARESPQPFELIAAEFYRENNTDSDLLEAIHDLLFAVATSDDVLSAEEELLLAQAAEIFGVSGPSFASFRRKKADQDRDHRRQEFHSDLEHEFFRILGLPTDAQPGEIKARYKRLVMQYHPDRVHYLGQVYRDEAEKKMKEINMAYHFFSKKYAF